MIRHLWGEYETFSESERMKGVTLHRSPVLFSSVWKHFRSGVNAETLWCPASR